MDPVSLTASALTFIGVVKKFSESLGQVSCNRRKLAELKDDVLSGLHDIQAILPVDSDSTLSPATQARIKADLDHLRAQLEQVHIRCNKLKSLDQRSKGLISGLASNIKKWTRSKPIESDIARLDRLIQASYTRFLVVTSADTRRTAHRTEERAILQIAEQRENLLRLETAFMKMVVDCDSRHQKLAPIWTSTNITEIELNFLARQARRIADAFDTRAFANYIPIEPPSGHHDQQYPFPPSAWDIDFDTIFNRSLAEACHASDLLVTRNISMQHCAKALLFLFFYLLVLGLDEAAAALSECAITVYSALQTGFPCPQYQRCLSYAFFLASRSSHPSERLSYSQTALDLYEDLFVELSDAVDLEYLIFALQSHSSSLMANGMVDESLDIARQHLMLLLEYNATSQDKTPYCQQPVVSWSASGEADVVLSSQRQFSLPSLLAVRLSMSLWNVACSLASLGQYGEARLAGIDAIECLTAFVQADPWSAQSYWLSAAPWRGELATWVSVNRSPSSSVCQLALAEDRDTARIEDAESTPSSAVVTA
ncbi:hypothetical protein HGRIS_011464 [Hohenbuehelia grisea]|uniref:Fungal N-terminal domain-containing protein n=1 Tax=Hohenbuehelia grisea TaxID=104357 RepID=A0ABR3JV77_9AGAR